MFLLPFVTTLTLTFDTFYSKEPIIVQIQAIDLSTSDRMGAVAKKAVELMQTLIRSDADPSVS